MAAEDREQRKRRERRDSGNSHERKERKDSSKERNGSCERRERRESMERAEHSEGSYVDDRAPSCLVLHAIRDSNRLESERRAERLSRRHGGRRRLRGHQLLAVAKENLQRSPPAASPSRQALLDRRACSQIYIEDNDDNSGCEEEPNAEANTCEVDGEEPIVSWRVRACSPSPSRLSPAPAPALAFHPNTDQRLEEVNRNISVLKRNISDYERELGRNIQIEERRHHPRLIAMMDALASLRAERKSIKMGSADDSERSEASREQRKRDGKLDAAIYSNKSLEEVIQDIEEWLNECRVAGGRAEGSLSQWNTAQLSAEKTCVQRALLRLEATRGRPSIHSAERGLTRHLYDRYRDVKRALQVHATHSLTELSTILEHEPLHHAASLETSSDSFPSTSQQTQNSQDYVSPIQSPPCADTEDQASSSSAATSEERQTATVQENLHCLSLAQLQAILNDTKAHKSALKKIIKKFETNYQAPPGKNMEEEYTRYKTLKARIRLITALINKQKSFFKSQ